MSIEEAIWGTIITVLTIYGGVSLIRDLAWKIILSIEKRDTLRKEKRLNEARKNWEKIPDCGGTAEGPISAQERIFKGLADNRFQRSRLGNF